MSRLRHILPIAVLLCNVLVMPRISFGNIKYQKAEKKPCITCHTNLKGKELNGVGKCYKEKQTLNGCVPKEAK
jgi:hypothetical protein